MIRLSVAVQSAGETIPEAWTLVEYTKDDGATGIYAECPACTEVIIPT